MSIKIAGREVKINDNLYHMSYEVFGTVVEVSSNSVTLRIENSIGGTRDIIVLEDGIVAGKKKVYWHEPILFDLPFKDLSPIQAVITNILELIYGDKHNAQ